MENHNSIKCTVLNHNGACSLAGCNCHLVHLAVGRGGKAHAKVFGFDVEEHQVDEYMEFIGDQ